MTQVDELLPRFMNKLVREVHDLRRLCINEETSEVVDFAPLSPFTTYVDAAFRSCSWQSLRTMGVLY